MTTIPSDTDYAIIFGLDPRTIQSFGYIPFTIGYNPAMDVFVFYDKFNEIVLFKEKRSLPDYFFDKIYNYIFGSLLHKDLDTLMKNSAFAVCVLNAFDKERFINVSMEVVKHYKGPERKLKRVGKKIVKYLA